MTRSRLLGLLGFFLFIGSLQASAAGGLAIDENKIRIEIARSATLKLPVVNSDNHSVSTELQLEFLNPSDKVLHRVTTPVVVASGSSEIQVPLPGLLELADSKQANFGWMRLKYSIPDSVQGIVSMSRIAREPFIMDVLAPRVAVASVPYRIQVFAQDSPLGHPAPNVEIVGVLRVDDEPGRSVRTRTSSSGLVELVFELPKASRESDLELEVTAKLGGFVRQLKESISNYDRLVAVQSTDKPIYQPGQKLRVRALLFDETRHVAKSAPLGVSISDPGSDKVFQTSLITSAFGEAHTEWEIPANARPGNYQIEVEPIDGFPSVESVWIGPYDLPNFSIEIRPDRPYYEPGQSAEIDVRADYLFGKPVPLARVKVVREFYRSWNYRELKWEVEEGETVEGITDRDGRFHATLGLKTDFEKLTDDSPYRDLDYTVHATDPTTGRTEQRRFITRITLFPIHLYLIEPFRDMSVPLEFYVSAAYADGRPAICDVDIFEVQGNRRLRLGTARTNKYGIAKVTGLQPSADFGHDYDSSRLELRAADTSGGTGRRTQYISIDDEALRIYTDKAIYRALEPIEVHLESTNSVGRVVLNATSDGRVVYNTTTQLAAGKADIRIPSSKAFHGNVLVSAYFSGVNEYLFEGRQVSFPSAGGLEIESSVDRKSYAPGDEVILDFRVRNGNGSPQESLLGISIFDKAVEERARTSAESGGRYSACRMCYLFRGELELPGFSLRDLDHVDRALPIPPDLQLAAETLLQGWDRYHAEPEFVNLSSSPGNVFRSASLQRRFDALKKSPKYPSGVDLPSDEAALREMVLAVEPEFDTLRDPWSNPYRLKPFQLQDRNAIEIVSAGADEQFGSSDDMVVATLYWPYFTEYGKILRSVIMRYHERTGGYVRDLETLQNELRREGHDFGEWQDPTGARFTAEFEAHLTRFEVRIKNQNGVGIWTEGVDYTAELQPRIDAALNAAALRSSLPATHPELIEVLRRAGISEADLRDPWGQSYYSILKAEAGYFDSITVTDGPPRVVPVTRQSQVVRLRSAGPDGKEGTPDDFTVATYLQPVTEQTVEAASPQFIESPMLDPRHGAIYGAVMDMSGAFIPGVEVRVTSPIGVETDLVTSEVGGFVIRNLDPGIYQVRLSLPGFQTKVLTGVVVKPATATRILATLQVGSNASNVEVSEGAVSLLATSASVGEVRTGASRFPQPMSTPKLREYFPETLFWQPALETGRDGNAQVRFTLADSVTTWKATAIASTKDGRIAVAEKEIVAFQPFFLEHDPPKFLTEGDQISLPIVARSYLDRDQSLDLSMKREDWLEPLDSITRKSEIKAGEATREIFTFKARTPIQNGRQRITAQGTEAGDAVEKSTTVSPFGREVTQVSSEIFRAASTQSVIFPSEALAGSMSAELKIYPNLMSHVVDAIEAIMRRPYGCAEQVISSAYPSLLYLRLTKQAGRRGDALTQKASRYVQIAWQTLRAYQTEQGGFSYWTSGEADTAVTAYALQFMIQAKEFITIDEDRPNRTREWLLGKQRTDGSWEQDSELTAYIANVLSTPGIWQKEKDPVPAALAYLEKQPGHPYLSASVALAAFNIGNKQLADSALKTLRTTVHRERDSAFWDLQTNTPFYGWGLPGRLESTAVAMRALAVSGTDQDLVDEGRLFLLRSKDQFGIWYSSQATVRVLETLALSLGGQKESPGSADVFVNGVRVATVSFGNRERPNNPVTLDLSKFMAVGTNQVEVRERKKSSISTVQLVASHYVPWNPSQNLVTGPVRLSVRFSKQEVAISEPVTVRVEADRVGFRGYGMMLAEIGLPPGADVDRASLSAAVESSGWTLTRYDVLPDRLIVYLWPKAGGIAFEFQFRPRYGLIAHTPRSTLYDYYNPDAYAILAPVQFTVR